jgi:hypothetical protein
MAGRSGQATTAEPPTDDSTKPANAAGTSSTTNPKPAPVERNVHWVDMHGYELAQVREFEPRCALLSVACLPTRSVGYRRVSNTLHSWHRPDRIRHCYSARLVHRG